MCPKVARAARPWLAVLRMWHGHLARGSRYAVSVFRGTGILPVACGTPKASVVLDRQSKSAVFFVLERKSRLRDCLYRWSTIDQCGIPHFMGETPMPHRTALHRRTAHATSCTKKCCAPVRDRNNPSHDPAPAHLSDCHIAPALKCGRSGGMETDSPAPSSRGHRSFSRTDATTCGVMEETGRPA